MPRSCTKTRCHILKGVVLLACSWMLHINVFSSKTHSSENTACELHYKSNGRLIINNQFVRLKLTQNSWPITQRWWLISIVAWQGPPKSIQYSLTTFNFLSPLNKKDCWKSVHVWERLTFCLIDKLLKSFWRSLS